MIWKNEAISKLKEYNAKRLALENIPLEIRQQSLALASIRSATTDSIPVRGNSSREDAILNNLTYRAELEESLTRTQLQVSAIERALGTLTPEERMLLNRFFITPEAKAAERLAGDLAVDVKTVYRRKDEALRTFTIALYGVAEN